MLKNYKELKAFKKQILKPLNPRPLESSNPFNETWTVAKVLRATTEYLQKHKIESPRCEAEMLLSHTLKMSRVDLYIQFERPLNFQERLILKEEITQRVKGVPLQYITGKQAFRYLTLKVTPDVLIPRPETELLVEAVIKRVRGEKKPLAILDIGTGSGAIALSLAYELESAHLWAVDVSEEALRVAAENAAKNGLEKKITFLKSFLYSELERIYSGKFRVIVANPPYVSSEAWFNLPAEVKREPKIALDGGPQGLDFYREIIRGAPRYLLNSGLLALEIDPLQIETISHWLEEEDFTSIEVEKDYRHKDRFIIARWAGSSGRAEN